MAIEKFNETKAIVEEIQNLEELIPVFKKSYYSSIITEEDGELGNKYRYNYRLRLNSDMNAKVLKILEDRLEYLRGALEVI